MCATTPEQAVRNVVEGVSCKTESRLALVAAQPKRKNEGGSRRARGAQTSANRHHAAAEGDIPATVWSASSDTITTTSACAI